MFSVYLLNNRTASHFEPPLNFVNLDVSLVCPPGKDQVSSDKLIRADCHVLSPQGKCVLKYIHVYIAGHAEYFPFPACHPTPTPRGRGTVHHHLMCKEFFNVLWSWEGVIPSLAYGCG